MYRFHDLVLLILLVPGKIQHLIQHTIEQLRGLSFNTMGLHNILGVLRNVPGVLCNVSGVLRNVLQVLHNMTGVLRNVPGVLRNVPCMHVVLCPRFYIDLGSDDSMAAWEGPIEFLLAKVSGSGSASGRIGIF